jgi:hypothetical protein
MGRQAQGWDDQLMDSHHYTFELRHIQYVAGCRTTTDAKLNF